MPLDAVVVIEKYCIYADKNRSMFIRDHVKKLVAQLEKYDAPLTSEGEQLLRARTRELIKTYRLERLVKTNESELLP